MRSFMGVLRSRRWRRFRARFRSRDYGVKSVAEWLPAAGQAPRRNPRPLPGARGVYICLGSRESAGAGRSAPAGRGAAEPQRGPETADFRATKVQGARPPCRVAIIVTSSSDPAPREARRLGQKGRVPSLHKPQRARGTCVGRRDDRYMVKRIPNARRNVGRSDRGRPDVAMMPQQRRFNRGDARGRRRPSRGCRTPPGCRTGGCAPSSGPGTTVCKPRWRIP